MTKVVIFLLVCLCCTQAYSANLDQFSKEKGPNGAADDATLNEHDVKDPGEAKEKFDDLLLSDDPDVPLQIDITAGMKKRESGDDDEEAWDVDENLDLEKLAKTMDMIDRGDEFLDKEQVAIIDGKNNPSGKRNAITRAYRMWPKSNGRVRIPYTISFSWDPFGMTKRKIKDAARLISRRTCIDWVPKSSRDKNWVAISNREKGCYSYVGRSPRKDGSQPLNLGTGCGGRRQVQHEMGHAMGYFHEQNRPDRDNYIRILWNNIQKKYKDQFNKRATAQLFGQPFDWRSVMLYSSKAFNKHFWQSTMEKKSNGRGFKGYTQYSDMDFEGLKKLYKC